jgi:hypothetical protein
LQLLFLITVPFGFVTANLSVRSAHQIVVGGAGADKKIFLPSTTKFEEGRRSIPMYNTLVITLILPVCFLEKGSAVI